MKFIVKRVSAPHFVDADETNEEKEENLLRTTNAPGDCKIELLSGPEGRLPRKYVTIEIQDLASFMDFCRKCEYDVIVDPDTYFGVDGELIIYDDYIE